MTLPLIWLSLPEGTFSRQNHEAFSEPIDFGKERLDNRRRWASSAPRHAVAINHVNLNHKYCYSYEAIRPEGHP